MKQKVIIIGQGYSGRLSIAHSVGEIGCEVVIIALVPHNEDGKTLYKKKPIDAYSKYVKQVYFCFQKDGDGIIRILLDKCKEKDSKPIIIPDNDFSAAIIDKNKESLKDFFLFPYFKRDSETVTDWMNKTKQKELAIQLGLNVASSTMVEIRNGKYTMPHSGVKYPCFAKPMMSIVGGKSGLKKCDYEADLRNHLDYMSKRNNLDVLLEDYKEIQQEYAVLGFSDGENVVIPGILKILKLAHGGHYGVAIQGEVSSISPEHKHIIEVFKKYILTVGFVGIFDFDYYKSEDVLYFGELNLRFGGSGYAYTKMGVNLPAMFVRFLSGEQYKDMQKTINGSATYINERMLIDEWYDGYISKKEMDHLFNSSDIKFVASEEDLEPMRQMNKMIKINQIKKFIKLCIGRK